MTDFPATRWREVFSGVVFAISQTDVTWEGKERLFERASCSDVVRVYPLNRDGFLTMIEEYRVEQAGKPILRTVSGAIERGESPVDAARRELREEVNQDAEELSVFHKSRPMIKVQHTVYHVLALNCTNRTGASQLEPAEIIQPIAVHLKEIPNLALSGELYEDIVSYGLIRMCRHLGIPLSE